MIALGSVSSRYAAGWCCLIPNVCEAYQRTTAAGAKEPAAFVAL
jgi:hypothetical protein